MKNLSNKKFIIFVVVICNSGLFSSQLHVSIGDPIYKYLERISTQGVLPSYMNATLPLTRDYISEMLIYLEEHRNKLSTIDNKILDEYLADYSYEIKAIPYFQLMEEETTYHPFQSQKQLTKGLHDLFTYTANQGDHHLVVYETPENLVWLDIGGMARNELQNSNNQLIYSYRYSLFALLSNKLLLYSEADLYEMLYNKDNVKMPSEFRGGFPGDIRDGYYGYKKSRAFDYSYGYLQYSSNLGDVILSMEPLVWGNAKNSIILSNNVNPFSALIWTKRIGSSRFTFLHGTISGVNEDVLSASDVDYASTYNVGNIEKYLVSHRWEIIVSNKLRGAFTEMLIYGGRGPELSYLIPPTLLWSVQHNTNNNDNIIWFIESEYFPFNGLRLFNTIMLDELTISKMFKDYMNNKWIIQGGAEYAYNIFNYAGSLNLEFTVARPWVYTHKYPETGSYTHNGRSLGFKHGPNSQLFLLENRWWINMRNLFSISYELLKWGSEPEVDKLDEYHFGNNVNENYRLANQNYRFKTGWIIGDIQTTQTVKFLWEYQISNIIDLELGFSHIKGIDESVNAISVQVNVDY